MHPYLFQGRLPLVGTVRVPAYGFMILIGFLLCLWLVQRRGRAMGIDPLALFDAATATLLGGIIGSRVLYVALNWEAFARTPLRVFSIWQGGLVFFGGLVGGIAGLLLVIWRRRLPVRGTLDVAASVLPLGHAFGRFGCFLNGCCYGRITDLWTGMRFPRILGPDGTVIGSPAFQHQTTIGWSLERAQRISETFSPEFVAEFGQATRRSADGLVLAAERSWSVPVHPTQLYAVSYLLAIFAILSLLLRRRRRPGQIAWLYAVLYGCARFGNEFLRADTVGRPQLGGLTIFQAIAVVVVLFGLAMLADGFRRPPVPLPQPWQPLEAED